MTTLSSKILSQDKEHFAKLAVDAVMRLKVNCAYPTEYHFSILVNLASSVCAVRQVFTLQTIVEQLKTFSLDTPDSILIYIFFCILDWKLT